MKWPLRCFARSAILFLIAFGCAALSQQIVAQTAKANLNPTTYYLHGRIYTNDPKHPWADAMATRDGQILCIGTISQILLDCGGAESNDVVQLAGHFVMPGFNDAHSHLGGAGRDKLPPVSTNPANGSSAAAGISLAGLTRVFLPACNSTRPRRSIPFISTISLATSPLPTPWR
jgi:imidazolonepropionase-like amidohydrolase